MSDNCFYIAGPMSWRPKFNIPMFDSAAAELRDQGFAVVSPAELDDPEIREACLASDTGDPAELPGEFDYATTLARDVAVVIDKVDAVVVLPAWETSRGARIEVATALSTGKRVYPYVLEEGALLGELPPETLGRRLGANGNRSSNSAPASTREIGLPHHVYSSGDEDGAEFLKRSGHQPDEVRIKSKTGGEKGRKDVRLDLVPPEPLWEVARVYGFGAMKYDDHNYLKGYAWSLSYAALLRHITQWANGESDDPESGLSHLAHAAWHCFALYMFQRHALGTDDRIVGVVQDNERIQSTGRSEAARQ
jgi:hypothetical protein